MVKRFFPGESTENINVNTGQEAFREIVVLQARRTG